MAKGAGVIEDRKRFYCNAGSRYADKHAIRINEQGHKTLVKTGEKTDIYAKIVSHKDECDIESLLARAEVEGYEILERKEASYGDVTAIPKSLLEAQIMLQDQENEFNHLPLEVRKQFNFSFSEYIAEAGNNIESWANKMGFVKEEAAAAPEAATAAPEGGEQ